jgi:hypothetical protein
MYYLLLGRRKYRAKFYADTEFYSAEIYNNRNLIFLYFVKQGREKTHCQMRLVNHNTG